MTGNNYSTLVVFAVDSALGHLQLDLTNAGFRKPLVPTHEADEQDAIVDLFDSDGLTCRAST